jgi:hypothetical protein
MLRVLHYLKGIIMLDTFLANLKKAIRDNETVTIGGGVFTPDELREILKAIEP